MIDAKVVELPVYVRGGSIIPMEPLVQSTEEKPNGPLTLRVFPGDNCNGSVYLDDGTTYDFRKGAFLRQQFSCTVASDGTVTVSAASAEGTFHPWWSSIRVEVVGMRHAAVQDLQTKRRSAAETTNLGSATTVNATGSLSVAFRPL